MTDTKPLSQTTPCNATLEFRLGTLRIRHCDEPSMIWIDRGDGEGGYFSLNEFHDMVQEFVSERL